MFINFIHKNFIFIHKIIMKLIFHNPNKIQDIFIDVFLKHLIEI